MRTYLLLLILLIVGSTIITVSAESTVEPIKPIESTEPTMNCVITVDTDLSFYNSICIRNLNIINYDNIKITYPESKFNIIDNNDIKIIRPQSKFKYGDYTITIPNVNYSVTEMWINVEIERCLYLGFVRYDNGDIHFNPNLTSHTLKIRQKYCFGKTDEIKIWADGKLTLHLKSTSEPGRFAFYEIK